MSAPVYGYCCNGIPEHLHCGFGVHRWASDDDNNRPFNYSQGLSIAEDIERALTKILNLAVFTLDLKLETLKFFLSNNVFTAQDEIISKNEKMLQPKIFACGILDSTTQRFICEK